MKPWPTKFSILVPDSKPWPPRKLDEGPSNMKSGESIVKKLDCGALPGNDKGSCKL